MNRDLTDFRRYRRLRAADTATLWFLAAFAALDAVLVCATEGLL